MTKSISYSLAHRRTRAALAGGTCAHCVLEVALKHDVPADRLLIGTGRYEGLIFSAQTSDYELRCARHHRLSDARQRRIAARPKA